jgi:hypothetical protein
MSPLLSASEMAGIQSYGLEGMITDVTIFETVMDTGTDETDDPYGSKATTSTTGTTVKGWLVGRWATDRDQNAGDIDTTTLYRLRLPVGTSVEAGWDVEISGHRYMVVDAGTDQTWQEWLNVQVRRSK